MKQNNILLKIKDLKVNYKQDTSLIEVVRGVSLDIGKGECVGLVGESGCGKSTVGISITKLIPERKGFISSGEILLEGRDLLKLNPEELEHIRGKRISYVFQEAFSSLNPVLTVYSQMEEVLPDRAIAGQIIPEILKSVGLISIAANKRVYPHELSGGMQQRVMIAMATASKPDLLVMDEPTTALDVTVQKKIIELMMDLRKRLNLSVLFISHDLNTVFKVADRINVMYAGRVVEVGPKEKIITNPLHPYTIGLIDSVPKPGDGKKKFNAIEGRAPLFRELPGGCKFHPRCKFRIDKCLQREPELEILPDERASRCIRVKELLKDGIIKG